MPYLRSWFSVSPSIPNFPTNTQRNRTCRMAFFAGLLMASFTCTAQNQPPDNATNQQPESKSDQSSTITIPAGTQLSLALTQPIQSRYLRRGDDIYAQITSPVTAGNEVAIPPGTFVQGTVDKLERHGGRAELRLQSMSITFPDGYVNSIAGPMTLESSDGYAVKDPGHSHFVAAFALPAAGVGLGALIGHSVGSSQSTLTSSVPPGCIPNSPGCLSSSLPVAGSAGKDTAIGAGIGGAIGMIASMTLLFSSHHFFVDVGSPVEMTLQHPVSFDIQHVSDAAGQSADQSAQGSRGTCYTAGTPGTPPRWVPGPPDADGTPGPPILIHGTPPTPPTPYPCP
jgi:hypothetical protein